MLTSNRRRLIHLNNIPSVMNKINEQTHAVISDLKE